MALPQQHRSVRTGHEERTASYNFATAKVLSILMVVTGHYFGHTFETLWIPVSWGLFVFAFSSGFFTSNKYRHPFHVNKFWRAKVVRLAYPILVIDAFLLALFLTQGRENILIWKSLPSLAGLNGFFAWFGIPNPSPFGAGLWFLTLLWLFYLCYPLIARINTSRGAAAAFLVIVFVATSILDYTVPMGHALWMSIFAFVLGSYCGVYRAGAPSWVFASLFGAAVASMVFVNLAFSFNKLNYFFVLAASMGIVGFLMNGALPRFGLNKLLLFSGCVIQIYFIHGYLFVRSLSGIPAIDYLVSMTLILAMAYALHCAAMFLAAPRRNPLPAASEAG